jgi:peptidoglycan/LPS O-acetylase OafA/YrhL
VRIPTISTSSLTFIFIKNNYYYVYQTNDLENFLLQIFFASNWISFQPNSFNGPVWSVSAEVFSYLIFFFSIKKFKKSLLINIFIIIFCVFLRVFKLSNPISDCLTIFFVCGTAAVIFKTLSASNYKRTINLFFFILAIIIPFIVIFFRLTEYKHFIYTFEKSVNANEEEFKKNYLEDQARKIEI